MEAVRDIYSGDVKIGTLRFQSTGEAHTGMTTVELAYALSRAAEAFKNSLFTVTDENPKLPPR